MQPTNRVNLLIYRSFSNFRATKAWFRDTKDKALHFKCNSCGKCCSNNRIESKYINSAELDAISNHLSIDKQTLFRDFIEESEDKDTGNVLMSITNKKNEDLANECIFLDSSTRKCAIHSVKPHVCEAYPFVASALLGESEWKNESMYCEGISINNNIINNNNNGVEDVDPIEPDDILRKLILLSIHNNGAPADHSLEQTYTEAMATLKACEDISISNDDNDDNNNDDDNDNNLNNEEESSGGGDMLGDFESEFFSLNRSDVIYNKNGTRVVDNYISNGDSSDVYRRMEFTSSTNFSQSEVALIASTGPALRADHSKLVAPFNKVMATIINTYLHSKSSSSSANERVLVLGAGACVLPMHLLATRGYRDISIDAVDIIPDLFDLSKAYFNAAVCENTTTTTSTTTSTTSSTVANQINPVTKDAIDFISDYAKNSSSLLYDAIVLDIFNDEKTAPPKSFLQRHVLEHLLRMLSPNKSVLVVNIYGDEIWAMEVKNTFDSVLAGVGFGSHRVRTLFVGNKNYFLKSRKTGNYILSLSNDCAADINNNNNNNNNNQNNKTIDSVIGEFTTII